MDKPQDRLKKPWPVKEAMVQIYERNLWGGDAEFYSGDGSHRPEIIQPYVKAVKDFIESFDEPLTICDLGCGDFNVGKELVCSAKHYTAVDIVPALIERNRKEFSVSNLTFQCLDIASDTLPDADCVIIRQVLQHLSNAEVQKVVDKLDQFQYILLTEHLPEGDFTPNLEIISGQGIRLKNDSGIDLLAPPFNLKLKEKKVLSRITSKAFKGQIVTYLLRIF
jgi:hypothetical protein